MIYVHRDWSKVPEEKLARLKALSEELEKIADKAGRVEKLLTDKVPVPKAVEELYLATWSRRPSADEQKKAEGWVTSAPTVRDGLQDLLWVLVNSREFLFNK